MGAVRGEVAHGFEHETIEAKAAWFRTLTVQERLAALSAMYELAVALNPKLREGRDAARPQASVRVLQIAPR